jgi:hypothetical protein
LPSGKPVALKTIGDALADMRNPRADMRRR